MTSTRFVEEDAEEPEENSSLHQQVDLSYAIPQFNFSFMG